jgi:hypothetical protein
MYTMNYKVSDSVIRSGAGIFYGRAGHFALIVFAAAFLLSFTRTAQAADWPVTISGSDASDDATTQNDIQTAIDGAASGDTVTISGSKSGTASTIALNIPSGVRAIWGATILGSVTSPDTGLLKISGSGAFETQSTALISVNGLEAAAIHIHPGGTSVDINGGIISSSGNQNYAIKADAVSDGIKVRVNDGNVSAHGNGVKTIFADGSGGATSVDVAPRALVEADGPGSYSIYAVKGASFSAATGTLVGPTYNEQTGTTGNNNNNGNGNNNNGDNNNNNSNDKGEESGCDAGIGGLLALSMAGTLIFKKR